MDVLGHLLDASLHHLNGPTGDPRRRFASGQLVRLRRGFYVPTAVWLQARPDERFHLAVAAYAQANPKTVFCGETGRLGLGPRTYEVRGDSHAATRARNSLPPPVRRHRHLRLDAEEVGEYLSVPLADALVEVLASAKFPRGLTIADGVLRRDPATPFSTGRTSEARLRV